MPACVEKTERRSVADIDIYDSDGQLVAAIQGLRSQRVTTTGRETLDDLLYAYKWIEKPLTEQLPEEGSCSAPSLGAWLIFADRSGSKRAACRKASQQWR